MLVVSNHYILEQLITHQWMTSKTYRLSSFWATAHAIPDYWIASATPPSAKPFHLSPIHSQVSGETTPPPGSLLGLLSLEHWSHQIVSNMRAGTLATMIHFGTLYQQKDWPQKTGSIFPEWMKATERFPLSMLSYVFSLCPADDSISCRHYILSF